MAHERAFIHVAGPKASGKTTFIEHVLRTVRSLVVCVRAEQDDRLREPEESSPTNHAELQRYRAGGARGGALYRFPPTGVAWDAFFETNFMDVFSMAVVIEGDRPLERVDLAAFVAPPPPPGGSLLRRVSGDRAAWEAAKAAPIGRQLAPTVRWALAAGYDGLEHAQLVVVNVRDAAERRRGEAMLDEVARLREDDEVFRDVLGRQGKKITAVVADLGDPRDAGLRKALARVKRSMRRST